jgi:hypothetical protein
VLAAGDAGVAERPGERAGVRRRFAVGIAPRPVAVVVGEELTVDAGKVVEELDQRAPRQSADL